MTPLNVEATMMAFAGSVLNITNGVIPRLMGVFINLFVGVEKGNMSNYYILKIINILFYFYMVALICLIPKKKDIDEAIDLSK